MRKDMRKVLCERPRAHSQWSYHDVRAKESRGDLEDLPSCQGMRRPFKRHWCEKEFTDHIMPLKRYMRSCIGRVYDDVWSEICAAVPSNNTVDQHLLGHARDEVDTHTYMVGDEVWAHKYGIFSFASGLYVDPRDGTIRESVRQPNRSDEPNVLHRGFYYVKDENGVLWPSYHHRSGHCPIKPFGPLADAMRLGGIWYELTYAVVPPARVISYIENGEMKDKSVPEYRSDAVFGLKVTSGNWYYATKRQLASAELRKHKLLNVSE